MHHRNMHHQIIHHSTRYQSATLCNTTNKSDQSGLSRKILLALATILLVTGITGCSTLERVVYRPDINQGNYLTASDVAKIHTGMTQQQVVYTLGTPMLTAPFGGNTWYFVFRQQPGHKKATQQTLTLTFNDTGILTHIDNQPQLAKR